MPRNFHSTFSRSPHEITPQPSGESIDYWDSTAVAACLMEEESYQVYLHMDQYNEQYVFDMALDEAQVIINARRTLLQQRTTPVRLVDASTLLCYNAS